MMTNDEAEAIAKRLDTIWYQIVDVRADCLNGKTKFVSQRLLHTIEAVHKLRVDVRQARLGVSR